MVNTGDWVPPPGYRIVVARYSMPSPVAGEREELAAVHLAAVEAEAVVAYHRDAMEPVGGA